MSVVVAHRQQSATSRLVLQAAAQEASLRGTNLSIIQISEAVDIDIVRTQDMRVRSEITKTLEEASLSDVDWTLRVGSGADVAETILDLAADAADAELLVIGARRRTPVGKMLMGSVTQTLLLRADVPVLVVKAPDGVAAIRLSCRARSDLALDGCLPV